MKEKILGKTVVCLDHISYYDVPSETKIEILINGVSRGVFYMKGNARFYAFPVYDDPTLF